MTMLVQLEHSRVLELISEKRTKGYICKELNCCLQDFNAYLKKTGLYYKGARNQYSRKFCEICGKLAISGGKCEFHKNYKFSNPPDISHKTKKELKESHKTSASARSAITKHAIITFFKSYKDKKCEICGYEKHVEVCHRKPVSEFSEDSLISEINHIDNLIGLCPNHHWEFDHGLLLIKNEKKRNLKRLVVLLKTIRNKKIKEENFKKKLEERKYFLEFIDSSQKGWLSKLSRLWGISHTHTKRILEEYFPGFLEKSSLNMEDNPSVDVH